MSVGGATPVRLAALLHGYTGGRSLVAAEGATLDAILTDLDRRYPGLRFRVVDEQGRIRRHMKVFIGQEPAVDLAQPIGPATPIYIVGALSGG